MKRIIVIISIILPAIAFVSCNGKEKKETITKAVKSYVLCSLKQQALPSTLRLPAQLNPYQIVDIFPKVNGYVKEMLVDMGSKVKQGEVLMIMEAPEVEQNNVSAFEKYNRAQASYIDSRDNYFRLLKTAETKGAVSPNDLQMAQSKMQ